MVVLASRASEGGESQRTELEAAVLLDGKVRARRYTGRPSWSVRGLWVKSNGCVGGPSVNAAICAYVRVHLHTA